VGTKKKRQHRYPRHRPTLCPPGWAGAPRLLRAGRKVTEVTGMMETQTGTQTHSGASRGAGLGTGRAAASPSALPPHTPAGPPAAVGPPGSPHPAPRLRRLCPRLGPPDLCRGRLRDTSATEHRSRLPAAGTTLGGRSRLPALAPCGAAAGPAMPGHGLRRLPARGQLSPGES